MEYFGKIKLSLLFLIYHHFRLKNWTSGKYLNLSCGSEIQIINHTSISFKIFKKGFGFAHLVKAYNVEMLIKAEVD